MRRAGFFLPQPPGREPNSAVVRGPEVEQTTEALVADQCECETVLPNYQASAEDEKIRQIIQRAFARNRTTVVERLSAQFEKEGPADQEAPSSKP